MILVDAGPLIALLDRDDRDHERCTNALADLSGPLITTWPALTEAIYLLGDRTGWTGQELLWRLLFRGDLVIEALEDSSVKRSYDLMKKYRDTPMDLADATLVALAESRGLSRIFTLDSDFRIYRIKGRRAFELVP